MLGSSRPGPFLLRSRSARKLDHTATTNEQEQEHKENVAIMSNSSSPRPPNEILLGGGKNKDDSKPKEKNVPPSDSNGQPFKVFEPTPRNEKPKKTRRKAPAVEAPSIVSETENKQRSLSKSRERQAKYMLSKHHLPRINRFMTYEELVEEAKCRGLEGDELPNSKETLLEHLVDNSIRIGETKVYKEYVKMLTRLEDERPKLEEKQSRRKVRRERRAAAQQAEQEELRAFEKSSQRKLHTHSFPLVHHHPLAKTDSLCYLARPRTEMSVCQKCNDNLDAKVWLQSNKNEPVWTCEQCDFDVCQTCFIRTMDENTDLTASSSRETQLSSQSGDASEPLLRQVESLETHGSLEESETRANKVTFQVESDESPQVEDDADTYANKVTKGYRFDPPQVFKNNIILPPRKNLNPTGQQGNGFTVWTSFGMGGKHAPGGEPFKEFDSTWATREDAVERSRYLYHWKNCWGDAEDSSKNGSCWTVGIATDSEFRELQGVAGLDGDKDEEVGSSLAGIERNEEKETKWDATTEFDLVIRHPSMFHKTPKDQHGTGFTVWCSCGFVRFGWDHEKKPPDQEFDSTWPTAEEANARAKYLFYYKNCWGLDPDELVEFEEYGSAQININESEGLVMFSIEPSGMERWTVGVVCDEDFPYLPQSTTERHFHDEDGSSYVEEDYSSPASNQLCSI